MYSLKLQVITFKYSSADWALVLDIWKIFIFIWTTSHNSPLQRIQTNIHLPINWNSILHNQNVQLPKDWLRHAAMATIWLGFWDTNIADMTSHENTHYHIHIHFQECTVDNHNNIENNRITCLKTWLYSLSKAL